METFSNPGVPGVPECAGGSPGTPGGVVCRRPVGRLTTTAGVTTPQSSEPSRNRHTQSWLTDRIETGRRAAKLQPCPRCAAAILVGPDDDGPHLIARVDPAPVTVLEEVVALLQFGPDHFSYDLIAGALHIRFPHNRARDRGYRILLDHRCNSRPDQKGR